MDQGRVGWSLQVTWHIFWISSSILRHVRTSQRIAESEAQIKKKPTWVDAYVDGEYCAQILANSITNCRTRRVWHDPLSTRLELAAATVGRAGVTSAMCMPTLIGCRRRHRLIIAAAEAAIITTANVTHHAHMACHKFISWFNHTYYQYEVLQNVEWWCCFYFLTVSNAFTTLLHPFNGLFSGKAGTRKVNHSGY